MIRKLITLIYKDLLLVIKDKAGVGFLFVMPVSLVFIMTLLQQNAYKTLHNSSFKLAILNNDQDSLGNMIVRNLKESGIFDVTEISEPGISPEKQVAKGYYKIGIVIPDSTTYYTRQSIENKISAAFNDLEEDEKSPSRMSEIEIYIDPVVRASYLMMVKSMLREFNSEFRTKILLRELNQRIPFIESDITLDNIIDFKEKYASTGKLGITPNSVQHNVPAWMLFAMFFIVISLAGNMVKEREDGSFARLRFMPVPYSVYISSKVIVYVFVCLVQFILMLIVGVYIMPLIGFPALQIGGNFISLFIIGLASALAAVGFGVFTGTFTRSYQQAATFGSLSVVILAAIGGIWVPVFMMPRAMQVVSSISPLNWGIEGFYNVLVRGLPVSESLNEIFLLVSFFIFTMIVSIMIYKYRTK
jgi:ABC-2 type transport system permease protein